MAEADELQALCVAYARAADGRDADGFAGLFTHDGELVVPRPDEGPGAFVVRRGRQELRLIPRALGRYANTRHDVGEGTFESVGDRTARGQVPCVAHHLSTLPDGVGIDVIWTIDYHDDYRLTADGWRIARRRLELHDVAEHQLSRGDAGHVGLRWST